MAELDHKALADSMAEGAKLDSQLAGLEPELGALTAGNPIEAVCSLWRQIRGAVTWVSNFPLIPGNIRSVLKRLIPLLDALCASGGNG